MSVENKTMWLVCLSDRFTKRLLSEIYLVEAPSIYKACDELQKKIGRKINVKEEYADILCVSNEENIHWVYRYSA